MREPPAEIDLLAQYDACFRKVPKRIFGLHEVARGLPALYTDAFKRAVPEDSHVIDTDPETGERVGTATVRCRCEAVTTVTWNAVEECSGECGRWFAFLVNGEVRWMPPDEAAA